jgi:NAD(P)H-dependent flavin oxidoreductase YrpB (nitropropane dioxygenase family)
MLTTRACTLLGIDHPVVLGGMAGGATTPELVAAVSKAGGLGIYGSSGLAPAEIARLAGEIRARTSRPFGLNLLLFRSDDAAIDAVLDARPAVFSAAWAGPDQDLAAIFGRARAAGLTVMYQAADARDARRAAAAGADLIVAQGTEGGGHVGVVSTMALVPQVVRAVAPIPVLAAGGIVDGAGLAAALMLGAEGVLMGTRFLATPEAGVPESFKAAIAASDGHDAVLTEIPDLISGVVWPGAYGRALRNRLIDTWTGREGDLRARQPEIQAAAQAARARGDAANATVWVGQAAGLVDRIEPAGAIVRRVVAEAEHLLRERAAALLGQTPPAG